MEAQGKGRGEMKKMKKRREGRRLSAPNNGSTNADS